MTTPEIQSRIAILRAKAEDNTATLDEMKEAVRLLRGDRTSAAVTSEKSRRTKAKAEVKSADAMLDELGNS